MEDSLQVVPLPWILRIEQLQELGDEAIRDVGTHDLSGYLLWHHVLQEKLIYQLQVWPSLLKVGFVLIWVNLLLLVIYKPNIGGRYVVESGTYFYLRKF